MPSGTHFIYIIQPPYEYAFHRIRGRDNCRKRFRIGENRHYASMEVIGRLLSAFRLFSPVIVLHTNPLYTGNKQYLD